MTFAIKNWARFQHYTKRHPPWIKLYHDLLDDDEFAGLDHFAQLLYFKLLMAASRKDNRIPEDVAWMATELSLPKARVQKALHTLITTGFLASEIASGRASNGASGFASQNASPSRAPARSRESEVEVEVENSYPVTVTEDVAAANGPGYGAELTDKELEALAASILGDMPE